MSTPNLQPLHGEHVFTIDAQLQAPPEIIGPVPEGLRITFYLTGGRADGPRLHGAVRASGADWFVLRRDGVGMVDVRGTIETDDGALIHVEYVGVGDCGENGYERFIAGDLPATVALRTTLRLRSAHPAYQWLHRPLFVGIGTADMQTFKIRYDIYALS